MSTKKDNFSLKDKKYMQIAINLAKVRKGLTGENPSVGCLIVKNDEIILSFLTITQPTEGFSPVNPFLVFAKSIAIFMKFLSFDENLSFFVDI